MEDRVYDGLITLIFRFLIIPNQLDVILIVGILAAKKVNHGVTSISITECKKTIAIYLDVVRTCRIRNYISAIILYMYLIENIFLLLSVENLWIYAVVGFVLTGGFVIILICYCCCYRSRKSRRQMNHLPSNKVNTSVYIRIFKL